MTTLLVDLRAALGPDAVLTGDAAKARSNSPWTRLGEPLAVLRPADTAEVSAILRLAHAAGAAVVPWGGRTGLVEGCSADGALALSLDRMNAVEAVDEASGTMRVQAGCVLQTA